MRCKKLFSVFAAFAFSMCASTAFAGKIDRSEVGINTSNPNDKFASGSMKGARFSSGTTQWIGCWLSNSSSAGFFDGIVCFATNTAGEQLMCFDSAPTEEERDLVMGLNDMSAIQFRVNSNNECTAIGVGQYSMNI